MPDFVLDASAALAWCFGDEATVESKALLDRLESGDTAFVPGIWGLEIANILALAERKRRLTAADSAEFIALLSAIGIRHDDAPADRALHDILALARQEGISSYDAAYLDLAMRLGLALATKDQALAQAAERQGATVIRC